MALLKQFKTPFGIIRVLRNSDGTVEYYQNGCFHSQSTPRGVSVVAYVHLVYQIIMQKKARKILSVGCGGGTLGTMLTRKGCKVTVVDINPAAFSIARDYFCMPESIKCVEDDGIRYIKTTKHSYDAVVIDVFDSHNNVPRGFTTKEFLGAAKKILKRGGVLIINVITKNNADKGAMRVAKNMPAAGMDISIYDWPGEKDRNTIVVGGDVTGVTIPSGSEPSFIKKDMKGLVCIKPAHRSLRKGKR